MHRRLVSAAVVAGLAVALPRAARAQSGLGVKGGFSYSNVSNSGVLPGDLHGRSGFAVGLGYEGGGPIGIGLEALYAQRGVSGGTLGQSRNLNYLDVPLYVRIGAASPGLSPFVYAGPQASFELQCTSGGESCPDTGRPQTTYAGVIGAGIRLAGGLTLEGRYVYGLTDLKLSTVTTSESYRNRSFMLLLGMGF